MIKIANNALSNCTSIDQIVQLINENETDATPELIAAAYAIDATIDNGYGMDKENLEIHLDTILENGAIFNYPKALEIAVKKATE